jgi:hypothetical protein
MFKFEFSARPPGGGFSDGIATKTWDKEVRKEWAKPENKKMP